METRRPSGNPKPAPYIDEWLSWGNRASLRARQGRGHVERHPQKGGKGKQGGPATSRVGKGQASQVHGLHSTNRIVLCCSKSSGGAASHLSPYLPA